MTVLTKFHDIKLDINYPKSAVGWKGKIYCDSIEGAPFAANCECVRFELKTYVHLPGVSTVNS